MKRLKGKPAELMCRVSGDAHGFVPSSHFTGARPGYVFKKGPQGTGYYSDAKVSAPSDAVEKSDAEKAGVRSTVVAKKGKGHSSPPLADGVDQVLPLTNGVDHDSSDEEEDQLAMQPTGEPWGCVVLLSHLLCVMFVLSVVCLVITLVPCFDSSRLACIILPPSPPGGHTQTL